MLNDLQKLSNCTGYGEYYEWASDNIDEEVRFGYFVSFDKYNIDKITKCTDPNKVIGVTSYSSSYISDDPVNWPNKYNRNEYGRIIMRRYPLVGGIKEYDQELDMEYIRTYILRDISPELNEEYSNKIDYIPRSMRLEWQNVILFGKCIVQDNNTCKPGEYCTIYNGDDDKLKGTAIPAKETDTIKYYVIKRISKKTILILFK